MRPASVAQHGAAIDGEAAGPADAPRGLGGYDLRGLFDTIELSFTFYRPLSPEAVERSSEQSPVGKW